jgi:hypothetical protein
MSSIKQRGFAFGATAVAALVLLGVGTPIARAEANMDKLMSVLPPGFDLDNCNPVTPLPEGALATVDCFDNKVPNGPDAARFSIVTDQATLDRKFQDNANSSVITPCPHNQASPGPWHYGSTPDQVAGQVACGVYHDTPEVSWSKNDVLLLGDIQGRTIDGVFEYWWQNI